MRGSFRARGSAAVRGRRAELRRLRARSEDFGTRFGSESKRLAGRQLTTTSERSKETHASRPALLWPSSVAGTRQRERVQAKPVVGVVGVLLQPSAPLLLDGVGRVLQEPSSPAPRVLEWSRIPQPDTEPQQQQQQQQQQQPPPHSSTQTLTPNSPVSAMAPNERGPGRRPGVGGVRRRAGSRSCSPASVKQGGKKKQQLQHRQRVKYSTVEIRAQETSKGGVKYEAILAEPAVSPPKRSASPTRTAKPNKPLEEKLKEAEERRLSFEASKVAHLAATMEKIEIIAKKREEATNKRKEALDQRMERSLENREAHINSLKEKVKDHLKKGEETRQSLDKQAEEISQALQESLKKAAEQRDENIKKMLERLQERDRRAAVVRQNKERLSMTMQENSQETASSG